MIGSRAPGSLGDHEEERQDVRRFFRLSETLDSVLRERAREDGEPVSKVVRLAIYQYLGIERRKVNVRP